MGKAGRECPIDLFLHELYKCVCIVPVEDQMRKILMRVFDMLPAAPGVQTAVVGTPRLIAKDQVKRALIVLKDDLPEKEIEHVMSQAPQEVRQKDFVTILLPYLKSAADWRNDAPVCLSNFESHFHCADVDSSGDITMDEFASVLSAAGVSDSTSTEMRHLFEEVDLDNSGTLKIEEFMHHIRSHVLQDAAGIGNSLLAEFCRNRLRFSRPLYLEDYAEMLPQCPVGFVRLKAIPRAHALSSVIHPPNDASGMLIDCEMSHARKVGNTVKPVTKKKVFLCSGKT